MRRSQGNDTYVGNLECMKFEIILIWLDQGAVITDSYNLSTGTCTLSSSMRRVDRGRLSGLPI